MGWLAQAIPHERPRLKYLHGGELMDGILHIVSSPEPTKRSSVLLIGGGPDYSDGATAQYIGHDRDIDGDDLAPGRILDLATEMGFDHDAALDALERYRILAKTI